jgi:hypothetical protein
MGQGRLEDLIVRAMRLQADFIVVDQDLTPPRLGPSPRPPTSR